MKEYRPDTGSSHNMENRMKLSFAVASHRPDCLHECVKSLRKSVDGRWDQCEIIIITDQDAAHSYDNRPEVQLIKDGGYSMSGMRNAAVEKAGGDYVYFMDDDIIVPEPLVNNALKLIKEHPGISGFGGPNLLPPGSSGFEKIQDAVLSSYWGSMGMRTRYRLDSLSGRASQEKLILCNLAFRRTIFSEENQFFDERLEYNEENEFITRLRKLNHNFIYTPDLYVYHHRRKNMKSFLIQVYKSGRGRARSIRIDKGNFHFKYFLPSLIFLFGMFFAAAPGKPVSFPFMAYLSVTLAVSFIKILELRISAGWFPLLAATYLTAHAGYGAGIIKGLTEKL